MMDAQFPGSCKQANYTDENNLIKGTGFFYELHRREGGKNLNEFCSYCDQLCQVEGMGVLWFINKDTYFPTS